jgi:hypothetical protein
MPRRQTLRSVKADAATTLANAQQLMQQASAQLKSTDKLIVGLVHQAMQTLIIVCDGVEEVMNGVEFTVTAFGRETPIKVRLKPREDESNGS